MGSFGKQSPSPLLHPHARRAQTTHCRTSRNGTHDDRDPASPSHRMNLLRRLHYLRNRKRLDADLAEEMEFHRAMLARDLEGDQPAAARALGNTTLARENARAVWILPWLESLYKDLAYGIRTMRREPGFTSVAVTALAIAIGLNTSLFTLFNAIALRPWPVKDPGRVVNVIRLIRKGAESGGTSGFGVAEWRYLSEHSKAFSGLLLTRNGERVRMDDQPLSLTWVTANYFSVLGVDMARGRGFISDEDRPQEPEAVVVLNHVTWQSRFAADPAIVGKTIRLDQIPFTIVGVAPEDFTGTNPSRSDFWAPFSAQRLLRPNDASVLPFLTNIDHCCSPMAGRLSPGYTGEQGAAEVELMMGQLHHQTERDVGRAVQAVGTTFLENAGRNNKPKMVSAFSAMFLAVTLVLLLACANVGNLLLARAAARRSEIAIRLSLGGSRARLIRQLLVESLTLACFAATAGLTIAWFAPAAILRHLSPDFSLSLRPDLRVCAYTAGLAVLACIVFGLAPALHATRGYIASALKLEAPFGAARIPLRNLLLATQVSISLILLIGAGLLIRGVQRAQHQDPGFRINRVTIAQLDLPAADYSGGHTRIFTIQLEDALARATDLPAIAVASDTPMANSRSWSTMRRTGESPDQDRLVQEHEVNAAYFDVLGIPVVAGRNFVREDRNHYVMLLNETAARRFWGSESPLHKTVESNGKTWEVVGIVRDAFTTDLNTIPPMMYWPSTGRFRIPQLMIADLNANARERVAAIVHAIEPRARTSFAPLSDNFQSML